MSVKIGSVELHGLCGWCLVEYKFQAIKMFTGGLSIYADSERIPIFSVNLNFLWIVVE
jgi:hypothetical protein